VSESFEPSALSASADARQSLAQFLRRNRQRAIVDWEHAVRGFPAGALLERKTLGDHVPGGLIDRLLELVEVPVAAETGEIPGRHAIERLREGFNLEQLAWEYSALRSTLLRLNEEEGAKLVPKAVVLLNDAIDQAVVRAIAKYHRARVRTLEALDRIAREGLLTEPQALDALLHRLLSVILDSVETVDTAVIYLCEWDRLVLRAAVGLEQDVEGRFSVAMGEGFAGTVWKTMQPLLTHSAETDPLVENPVLRMKGVKALYGIPLVCGDALIGVAKMGSRTATDFLPDDRLILTSTAERAAAFISQKRIAEDRELFLHVLGHDLRSPLNSIVLGAKLVEKQEPLPSYVERGIGRVLSAAERMDRLIGDMTDFTKVRVSGGLPLERESVDLGELVAEIAREVQAKGGRELQLERVGDATGEWDRGRLLRLIANLVNNAVSYGDASKPVTLRVEGADGRVVLSVHNEGDPIPPELQPHLFEVFRRGSKGAGSGLGLYIVQEIAHAHGGRVDVDSAPGRGTTFYVRLPRLAIHAST
jgi:nitrogen-specific signal transduction histidine kinase